jgi:hypothetical protein
MTNENSSPQKNPVSLIVLLLLLIGIGLGVYFFVFAKKDEETDTNDTETTEVAEENTMTEEPTLVEDETNEEEIEAEESSEFEPLPVEPGETLEWEGEQITMTLPLGWTAISSVDPNYNEAWTITAPELIIELAYLPIEDGYMWANWDNVVYKTSFAYLVMDQGEYKVALNRTLTLSSENFETGESTTQEYGLFMVLSRDGVGVTELSDQERSEIMFVLDDYSSNE